MTTDLGSGRCRSENQTDRLAAEVADRFGVLPNFFRLDPEAPEIMANLWEFARFGYLDNPLPPLFKERLFVYLSRFCEVRYCMARHVGFLIGLGRPAGDRQCPPETVDQAVRLIRRPLPRGKALEPHLSLLERCETPLPCMPQPDTLAEVAIFACATHVFLQTPQAPPCLEGLRRSLDAAMFRHLTVLLTFVRTAHYWTKTHPELELEDDVKELLATHEALAECVLNDPEAVTCEITSRLVDELAMLRLERSNQALRESERRFREIIDALPAAIYTTDAEGRLTHFNPAAVEFSGRVPELGSDHWCVSWKLYRPDGTPMPHDECPMAVALKEGRIVRGVEAIAERPDGKRIWFAPYPTPLRDTEGRLVGGVNMLVDITERKLADEKLRESEERFRSLTEALTSVVWTTDAEGRFVTPQPSWSAFTGQTWEELRDFGWTNALHPDDRGRVRELWEAACASKTPYKSDGRLWHAASASYRHFEARGVPILSSDGSVREWVGKCLDVEDRKRAVEGIERQREDLQSLIMQSPVPFCVFKGPDLVFEMANAAYLEVVGGRDILGKPLLSALPEFRGQGFDELLRGVMRAGEPVVGREALFMLEREGRLQETYWTFICSPLRDADGAVNRVVALCDDVTEQRRLVNELIEADRRKDEFLATLAHELRNPLAPLSTSVQLLRRNDPSQPALQRATDLIDRQVQQMVRLVDDLLDVSRITLDKLELRKRRVTLALVVQAAVEASRPLIEQCGHELTVTLPPEPVDLDADLTRLAQVFLNLLNNAAKYTERGGRIRLIAEREGGDVVVRVSDSGVGIAAEMLPRVFEMFMQVDQSLDRSQGGLGIGLTLVKRLVQMHDGSIEARSEGPGKGSEFVVRLPVATLSSPGAHPANGEAEQPAPISSHRILVVDDNQDAAETLAELLQLTGNDLRTAHDGVEAVEVAREFRPDVVLLDIGLPRMNGYEVAQKIREQPWGQGMVLVALTGWGQEEDRRRSRKAGFDHHMIKPVEPDALLELLTSIDDGQCSAQ